MKTSKVALISGEENEVTDTVKSPHDSATRRRSVSIPRFDNEDDKKMVVRVFTMVCLLVLSLNLDAGIIASSKIAMQSSFELNYLDLGVLGALTYVGLALASKWSTLPLMNASWLPLNAFYISHSLRPNQWNNFIKL
jgi:hypothetical protein